MYICTNLPLVLMLRRVSIKFYTLTYIYVTTARQKTETVTVTLTYIQSCQKKNCYLHFKDNMRK